MNNNKKPFSDKRWTQPLGGKVVGYQEVTEEQKQRAKEFLKHILKDKGNNNGKNDGKE